MDLLLAIDTHHIPLAGCLTGCLVGSRWHPDAMPLLMTIGLRGLCADSTRKASQTL